MKQNMHEKLREKKKTYLLSLVGVVVVIAIFYFIWSSFLAGNSISTDNAYTGADEAMISPLINAPVRDVKVIDTQHVNKGDILVVLNDEDAKIAFDSAKANLELVKRKIKQLIFNNQTMQNQIDLKISQIKSYDAGLKRAKIALAKANIDERRRRALLKVGGITKDEMTDVDAKLKDSKAAYKQAEADLQTAKMSVTVAKAQKLSDEQLIINKSVENNPQVLQAKASLDQAKINLQRCVVKAPISGVIVQKDVEKGQYVGTSSHLLSIVPSLNVYVNANFKEAKLADVKIGQEVSLYSDLYGSGITYKGVVVGISGATGSALSVIPAQNATGNWIKVVQRLPIRIKLNQEQLKKYPLSLGLSMHVTINLDKVSN